MMGLKKKLQGLTLIEVMIAIIIFGTGILVILSMLLSSVGLLYDIKEKDTALTIAKEGIDLVYHIRDSNLERGLFRDCAEIDLLEASKCGEYFYDGTGTGEFVISLEKDDVYSLTTFSGVEETQLRYHTGTLYTLSGSDITGFWYDHDSGSGEPTIYYRTIEFAPLSGYEGFTGFVLEVTSHVTYSKGDRERSVALQSIIGDIR